MWLRLIGAVVAAAGLLTAGYLGWARYRISDAVSLEPGWPRPWPYPDQWVLRWVRHLCYDQALRSEGKTEVARRRLAQWATAALAMAAVGSTPLAMWYRRRRLTRRPTGDAADYSEGFLSGGDPAETRGGGDSDGRQSQVLPSTTSPGRHDSVSPSARPSTSSG
jgi:hypothetical protein